MSDYFSYAVPVFEKGKAGEMNITMGLYSHVNYSAGDKVNLIIACSGIYRIFINGIFFSYGPARCGHGWYRCDFHNLEKVLIKGENHIAIETNFSNVNAYSMPGQSAFVQCELLKNGMAVAATGSGNDFVYCTPADRIRKTQRYSFQRTFTEVYNIGGSYACWRLGDLDGIICETEETENKNIIARRLPPYSFPSVSPAEKISFGMVAKHSETVKKWHDRSLDKTKAFKCFPYDELDACISDEISRLEFIETDGEPKPFNDEIEIAEGYYKSFSFDKIYTGFIALDIGCTEDAEMFVSFDERYSNRTAYPLTGGCVNAVKLNTEKGKYSFMTMEPYGGKYLGIICTKGSAVISNIRMVRYECPTPVTAGFSGEPDLEKVWNAAVNTFRQNTLDIFMDCPTRERAGWLCDSFFTARTEKVLTGGNNTESLFLENFALPDKFEYLPDGMLPMCYPADHNDGVYIPNWAMWFVIQLADHVSRGNKDDLPEKLKDKVFNLLKFLEKYENEDGLLESLDSWVFVEWSEANDFVQDVNYPSNMLYAGTLRAAGELYSDDALIEKSEKIKDMINRQSFDGTFYRDHSVRNEKGLEICGDVSETCQYYAFFFGIATPVTRPELWKKLITEFGPDRKKNGTYPDVCFSNSFIGNYLRLDILSTNGLERQCLDEMTGYFLYMAQRTGTLWENVSDGASCNHGFASYAAVLIDRCTKGIKKS